MPVASKSISSTLTRVIFMFCGAVLLVTIVAFSGYEWVAFRQTNVEQLRALGAAIASSSTAALAFDNADDAAAELAALKTDPHIVSAALYDQHGKLFATYPRNLTADQFPPKPSRFGYAFDDKELTGFEPVKEGTREMGALYLKADVRAMYTRIYLFALIIASIGVLALPVLYLLSRSLLRQFLQPILLLADTARAVSERRDYTVRAAPTGAHELDTFTETFNQMLGQIQQSEARLQDQLARLGLLQHITHAIGDRQDLHSIFQVVLRSLEDSLPIDFGCVLLYDASHHSLTVQALGSSARAFAARLNLSDGLVVPIDQNGLSRAVHGRLVYEPEVANIQFPFPQRLANAGLHSLVIAPLLLESEVFGVLVCARVRAEAFSSGECEFLKQLSEHVALASHQARLYGALRQAYDELRQSQHTVMQQERLRALGQMASGIAHDINNAISPVSLYTESLLEREPSLSDRARNYLIMIQRAIEDVARTVARMREFYRDREAQLTLAPVRLNTIIQQIVELTRPRWSDQPQQRGVMVDLIMELAESLPETMGAEHEIRDALTNLIFNAVDAMPDGGKLTIRTRHDRSNDEAEEVIVEVADTGVGMDENTRRRCLEPFYTTKGERGTGLGLAMVYGMIQRHSSQIDIESTVGEGTTVRLTFPALVVRAVAQERVIDLPASTKRRRILLVDDDPMLIKSLQDTLQEDGHVVTPTHGGQAGIDTFASTTKSGQAFDLVITDLGMPHVDGRKVAASVKELSAGTPVILLTGWGQRMIAENDTPPHVDRVLSKPPRLRELRAALAELCP
jgi:signal transduction histidine kinase/ActR/RegA family two-component response regulator